MDCATDEFALATLFAGDSWGCCGDCPEIVFPITMLEGEVDEGLEGEEEDGPDELGEEEGWTDGCWEWWWWWMGWWEWWWGWLGVDEGRICWGEGVWAWGDEAEEDDCGVEDLWCNWKKCIKKINLNIIY